MEATEDETTVDIQPRTSTNKGETQMNGTFNENHTPPPKYEDVVIKDGKSMDGKNTPPPNDKPDADEKEDKKVKRPMVGVLELFKYADGKDRFLMVAGMICASLNGATSPLMIIVFGTIMDTFLGNDQSINFWKSYGLNITVTYNVTYEQFLANSTLSVSVCKSLGITKACDVLSVGAYDTFFSKINQVVLYFVMIAAGSLTVSYIQLIGFQIPSYRQGHRIRNKLFSAILRQDIGWFDTHEAGELNTRLAEDVNQIEAGIGEKLGSFFQYLCAFIAGFIAGLVYGWKLTLVILAVAPLLAISSAMLAKVQASFTTKELTAYAKAGAVAEEVFGAIRTVVAFGGEKKETNRYESHLTDAKKQGIKKSTIGGATVGMTYLIMFFSYSLAFWFGAKLVREDPEYTGGTLLIVFFCILIGAFSLGNAAPSLSLLSTARGAAHQTFAVIETVPSIDSSKKDGLTPEITGNVVFKDIVFNYPSRPDVPILQGLNLTVSVGQTVALVGSSGCGKSTTIQLLQRFYDPLEGSVFIDGVDIREMQPKWLRDHIGVVSQEPVLFATTIEENIRYGRDDVTEKDIERAAKEANAHDFISKLPLGYDTLVGERGAQLSGGQKQRIAIARALVRDPKILLLDEATSALDTASESVVQSALDKARMGRTTIVIAHRLSTIKTADVISGFDNGVVVEKGSHDELMSLNGIYHALVMNQTNTYEEEPKEGDGEDEKVSDDNFSVEAFAVKPDIQDATVSNKKQLQGYLLIDAKNEVEEDLPAVPITRIMRLNAPETFFIIIGCSAALVNGAVQPLFSFLFASIISIFGETDLKKQEATVSFYSCLFMAIGGAAFLSNLTQEWALGVSGENLTLRMRQLAFKAMARQDITWFDRAENNVGALTTRLATDASTVRMATGSQLALVIKTISSIIIGITIGFYYSWKLTLVILCFAPVIFSSSFIRMKLVSGGTRRNRDKQAMEGAGKVAIEAVENIRTVASLTKENKFYSNYCELVNIPHDKRLKRVWLDGLAYGFAQSVQFLINAAVFSYGAHLIKNEGLSFESMFKVFSAIIFTASAVGQSSSFGPDLAKAKTAAARIFSIVDRTPDIDTSNEDGKKLASLEGVIEFSDVHFNYPTREKVKVLQGLNLSVRPGQTIALVGASGCGKSTSIQLMERFYDPKDGKVTLDSEDIKDLQLSWYRSQISLVSQEPVLFGYSVRENIEYGDNSRKVTMDEVISAARQANIHSFIESLPEGYETNVGDKGAQLSGGQKQRVAIARALVRNPKVLLLDEATSALDTESEKVVQEALDNARQGRTCLVIAHRLSTIRNADCIVVIDNGQISEMGTHDELMKFEGLYYKLNNVKTLQS